MLAEMIDKIVSLRKAETFEIGGETYATEKLVRIPPYVDRPEAICVNGLDSICKLIRTELYKFNTAIMLQVKEHHTVDVFTSYLADYSRNRLYRATADVPGMRSGWRDHETALIELRSLFIPNKGTEYLLDLLSRMGSENTVQSMDNGVTQTVETKQGVSLKVAESVKPRVLLKPFRHIFGSGAAGKRILTTGRR